MDKPTPCVNSTKLGDYVGQTVRLTGKVLKKQTETAILESSDGGQVEIHLNRESDYPEQYVEVIGRVNEDLSIMEYSSISMGNDLDLKIVNSVTDLMARNPDIFV